MPRSTRSSSLRTTTPIEPVEETMTTVTDTMTETDEDNMRDDLSFEIDITPAPQGERPDRSPAGRKRMPSPFESRLPDLKGKDWHCQPHDGKVVPYATTPDGKPKFNTLSTPPKNPDGTRSDIIPSVKGSNAKDILRELSKAVKFLNTPASKGGEELNLGLDVHVTETHVWFNIRDKQARKSSTPDGEEAIDGERDDDDLDLDDTGDE